MTRGRLAVHAHFYQPSRLDPWTGRVPAEPSAAPFHDWNQRVDAECYRPNAERGNLRRISWDLGPTLATWLAAEDPATHARFVADGAAAIAQPFHHAILPLASATDRRTEIAWGIRDFELRMGRKPAGLWLPETAVDLATLREAARQGIAFTILAPWQAATPVDTRRIHDVDLGDGRRIAVAFYDAGLSAAVSFEPEATANADRFARERVAPRLRGGPDAVEAPLALIATDGELYGHHQQFRDLFLQRLVGADGPPPPRASVTAAAAAPDDRGFDVVTIDRVVAGTASEDRPLARIAERTSWSCHHGVLRWTAECPDAADGRWKGPLRAALERLAGGIDAASAIELGRLAGGPDLVAARERWVDVVVGRTEPAAVAAALWGAADGDARRLAVDLLEAQRWRLAMFASDGWYWDDPIRPETRQVLRSAARAARLVDGIAGTGLERRLVEDLGVLRSPSRDLDGAAIYRLALADVGQPPPA